jgi:hypothetical protein
MRLLLELSPSPFIFSMCRWRCRQQARKDDAEATVERSQHMKSIVSTQYAHKAVTVDGCTLLQSQ